MACSAIIALQNERHHSSNCKSKCYGMFHTGTVNGDNRINTVATVDVNVKDVLVNTPFWRVFLLLLHDPLFHESVMLFPRIET